MLNSNPDKFLTGITNQNILFYIYLPYYFIPIFDNNYEATIYTNHFDIFSTGKKRSNGVF